MFNTPLNFFTSFSIFFNIKRIHETFSKHRLFRYKLTVLSITERTKNKQSNLEMSIDYFKNIVKHKNWFDFIYEKKNTLFYEECQWFKIKTKYLKYFKSFHCQMTLLYLFQLAHEAFKVAQSLDPSYVGCWIGQVNENILILKQLIRLLYHT